MRITLSIFYLNLAAVVAYPQGKHWSETPDETIWRGRYGNCDHGYFVNLSPGVIGLGSLPPSPNHGILISAKNPGTTTEVTFEKAGLITVNDTNDAMELAAEMTIAVELSRVPGENAGPPE